jgi:hypothetical protein
VTATQRLIETLVMVGVMLEMSLPEIPHFEYDIFCAAVDSELEGEEDLRGNVLLRASFMVQLANTRVLTLFCSTIRTDTLGVGWNTR